jgi:hypothetical protein
MRWTGSGDRRQQIDAARRQLAEWRREIDKLKQRLASLTIAPPTRVQ